MVPKPVTHPKTRAWLLWLARRIRAEGRSILAREPSLADRAAGGPLFFDDRAQASDWCAYAAEIVEAGAGGAALDEDGDGDGGCAPPLNEPARGKPGTRH
jgi:hypothetical protein